MVSQDKINDNFLNVIRWLKSEYGYTQAYIVEKAELAPNAISKIKNGKTNAGDETITKLCNAFSLNPDYIYGRSPYKSKLKESEAKLDENIRQTQAYIDPCSQMNATIAAQMKTIEVLEAQAVEKDERIAELKTAIAHNEEIIKARDARITELERQLAAARMSDIDNYHFPIGAAEGKEQPNI